MKQILINGFRLNVDYTLALVQDVPDGEMADQPNGFTNHPMFTLGHLITAIGLTSKMLGNAYDVPKEWDELFRRKGPGDPRKPNPDKWVYPSKDELIKDFQQRSERLIHEIEACTADQLSVEHSWKFNHYMPTVADVLYFMCFIHHSWHIGQLAEWRRFKGMRPVLADLVSHQR